MQICQGQIIKLALRRRCFADCSEYPCNYYPYPFHSKSIAGWGHWQRLITLDSRWRGTSGCPGACDPVRSVRVLDGSWQWKGIWGARSWRCWQWQIMPLPPKSGATFPSCIFVFSHCTVKMKRRMEFIILSLEINLAKILGFSTHKLTFILRN